MSQARSFVGLLVMLVLWIIMAVAVVMLFLGCGPTIPDVRQDQAQVTALETEHNQTQGQLVIVQQDTRAILTEIRLYEQAQKEIEECEAKLQEVTARIIAFKATID